MLTVAYNEIEMTRGDTVRLDIGLADASGADYTLQEGDTLCFSVKRSASDIEPLITKELSGGQMQVVLLPADTAGLAFGEYLYDVQLTMASGDVYTVIPPRALRICEEVSV